MTQIKEKIRPATPPTRLKINVQTKVYSPAVEPSDRSIKKPKKELRYGEEPEPPQQREPK